MLVVDVLVLNMKKFLPYIVLFIIGFAIYSNCLSNEMFWDDDDFILNNEFVHDASNWKHWFTDNVIAGRGMVSNYYRPLLLGVFSAQWAMWKDWVVGYHLTSVFLHIACGFLIYSLLGKTFSRNISLALSALWIAHPMHSESVVYANSLGDQLFTVFVLSGLLLYEKNYFLSLLCYPLAIMSKETGIILMPLLALSVFIRGIKGEDFIKIIPFVVIAGFYVYLRATILNFGGTFNFSQQEIGLDARFATFFASLAWYIGFILFPYDLRVERLMPFHSFNTTLTSETWNGFVYKIGVLTSAYDGGGWVGAPSIFAYAPWIGVIIFIFAAIVFFNYLKTKPLISLGIGWFFIAWLPMANLFNIINSTFYEHFMYVPMVGILIILGSILCQKKKQFSF